MSTSREKRDRKFRQMNIAPTIVGIVIFTVLFETFFGTALASYIEGITYETIGKDTARLFTVAELADEAVNNAQRAELAMYAEELVPGMGTICTINSNGGVVNSIGSDVPDMSELSLLRTVESDGHSYSIYVKRDSLLNPFLAKADYERATDSLKDDLGADSTLSSLIALGEEEEEREASDEDDDSFEIDINIDPLSTESSPVKVDVSMSDEAANFVGDWSTNKFMEAGIWIMREPHPDGSRTAVMYRYQLNNIQVISLITVIASIFMMSLLMDIYVISSIINIVRSRGRLQHAIYIDNVTGGRNWLYYQRYSRQLTGKKRIRGGKHYAVVHIRLEKYRAYCVCLGTKNAEAMVERLYNALTERISSVNELAVRREQADFALILLYTSKQQLDDRINVLRRRMAAAVPEQKVAFSVGVCPVQNRNDDPEALYLNAGLARKVHDDDENSDIEWFNESMQEEQLWERRVENEAEKALKENQFKLYLQPKYSTCEEKLSGAEALVRWVHPQDGLISPGKFIPIFENNGFILKLDDYMLMKVAEQQAKWLAEGRELVPISVNVSRAHFLREDLAEHIRDIVDSYGVPHETIELELTESAFFDDREVLVNMVDRMRSYGFSVSMDDFGAGYSSLNSLKELAIDVVKLDAEFFRSGNADQGRGELVVSETIELAKKLGMRVVAEGIETREQVDFLAGQQCDMIQGFYFAKPMPIEDFESRAWGGK